MSIEIKFTKIKDHAIIPKYAHPGDAGFDLHAIENYLLNPGERIIVKTGLQMEIPSGYYGSIRDRSGLAAKHGIHVLAGVVDSEYRGEVGVVLVNLGEENFKINKLDRIAQMIIQPHAYCEIEETKEVSDTVRGEGGFGSTGVD